MRQKPVSVAVKGDREADGVSFSMGDKPSGTHGHAFHERHMGISGHFPVCREVVLAR